MRTAINKKSIKRLRPDDHFLIISESKQTPMHIGAFIPIETNGAKASEVYQKLFEHIGNKISKSPLACKMSQSPNRYDSDAWFINEDINYEACIKHIDTPLTKDSLNTLISEMSMTRLDLSGPPFRAIILTNIEDNSSAFLFFIHHAFSDGVGFQTFLNYLADDGDASIFSKSDWPGAALDSAEWEAIAKQSFDEAAERKNEIKTAKSNALAALKDFAAQPGNAPIQTPTLRLSGHTCLNRNYRCLSFSFPEFKQLSKALAATVNDTFFTLISGAMRNYLIGEDDLPSTPLVVNMARSYRTENHGVLGNRIVAMNPELATDEADPLARLKRIQTAIAKEKKRSEITLKLLDQPEIPFGPLKREERIAARKKSGASLIPGNVTLSNVPGPSEDRYFAGWRQISNFPIPVLGNGRFLNITSRRNGARLDWGVMCDPEQVKNIDKLVLKLEEAWIELQTVAKLGTPS